MVASSDPGRAPGAIPMPKPTRRQFLASSSSAVIGTGVAPSLLSTPHIAGRDTIRVALVGCGGRGTGAVGQIFNTSGNTRLVAVADAFAHKANGAVEALKEHAEDKVGVSPDTVFSGLDAYKRAIDTDCDLVVIATPPGFKPQQFDYAVKQGKHVFMEKPVATDAPGVRRVLRAVAESKRKNLMVGIGLQRRHEPKYMETIQRVHDGAIGDIVLSRVYWNGGGIWYRNRKPGMTEMEFQCNNWYHFNWICGDQIVEQHIHNLDVGCWAKNAYPVKCNGMGGGEMRMGGDRTKSQIFDHTFCEYTFADGSKMYSQGRHLSRRLDATSARRCTAPRAPRTRPGRIDGPNAVALRRAQPGRPPAGAARPDRGAGARRDLQRGRVRRLLDADRDPRPRGVLLGQGDPLGRPAQARPRPRAGHRRLHDADDAAGRAGRRRPLPGAGAGQVRPVHEPGAGRGALTIARASSSMVSGAEPSALLLAITITGRSCASANEHSAATSARVVGSPSTRRSNGW